MAISKKVTENQSLGGVYRYTDSAVAVMNASNMLIMQVHMPVSEEEGTIIQVHMPVSEEEGTIMLLLVQQQP